MSHCGVKGSMPSAIVRCSIARSRSWSSHLLAVVSEVMLSINPDHCGACDTLRLQVVQHLGPEPRPFIDPFLAHAPST
jgi:hypothetical protein